MSLLDWVLPGRMCLSGYILQVHYSRYVNNAEDANLKNLVFKIVINVCKTQLYEKVDELTAKVWQVEGENQRKFIHQALMMVQPWSCYLETEALKMNVHEALKASSLVNAAYAAIVNIGEDTMCL